MAVTTRDMRCGAVAYMADGNHGMPCFGIHETYADSPSDTYRVLNADVLTVSMGNLAEADIEAGLHMWINNTGLTYRVIAVSLISGAAAGQAGTIAVDVCPSATAPGAGVDLVPSFLDGETAADAVLAGTLEATTLTKLDIDNGESICLSLGSGDLATLADCTITVTMVPKTLTTASAT